MKLFKKYKRTQRNIMEDYFKSNTTKKKTKNDKKGGKVDKRTED